MEDKLLNEYLHIENKKSNISRGFTKVLVSLIVFFSCLIYSNFSESNKNNLKKYFFENTFDFMKFKKYYTKIAGDIKKDESKMVFSNDLEIVGVEKYLDGEKLIFNSKEVVKNFGSGIVVFNGEKEGYGNTVIIQGSNGYDIWYGNLEDISVVIYDYIDENTILGQTDNLYLVITKNGKYYNYEEYKNQI